MRIGVVAARLGDVDGVSFEVVKWQAALERLGHEVFLCAGSLPDGAAERHTLVPEMHLAHPASLRVSEAAFDPASDRSLVRAEIERLALPLADRLAEWLAAVGIERLVVQNAWAIPMQLPLGVALARLAAATGIPSIAHNHDYWWERERFQACILPDLLDSAFPPRLASVRHVSINSLAAAELRERRGIASSVIPNVFDFEQARPADVAARAVQLRTELGLAPDRLLIVQPTRVVPRKGIELAVEFVARLGDPDAVLLITGPAGDEGYEYLIEIEQLAERRGVDLRYAAQRFRPSYSGALQDDLPEPTHSLVDAYVAADLITYPSLYEGFGNALVEAVYFGKPVLVNRYPVYAADIGPLGFRFIEIDGEVTDAAVERARALLADPGQRRADAAHNFTIGSRHLSYARLAEDLRRLLA
jgi:mannosylglucosylglycerate synthase